MWNRVILKERGRNAFRANRVTCIFASFILSVAAGGGSIPTSTVNINNEQLDINTIPPEVIKGAIAALGLASVAAFLLSVFVFNPVQVGLKRFFVLNATDSQTGLDRNTIGRGFVDGNYTNVVAAMFTRDLFVFLWTLCFIVPGIIKAYSWRMVPYIIAEDPQITGTEARMRSAQLMYGSKMDTFVLDLSFIGWAMLGVLTLGIGNIIWTNPYHDATDAELYRTLKGETSGTVAEPELEEALLVDVEAAPKVEDKPAAETSEVTAVTADKDNIDNNNDDSDVVR
jgi:uncharacterized membrane protein